MIVADTGAIVALVDTSDRHHRELVELYEEDPDAWVLPWAILAEVDYLLASHVGADARDAFHQDVTEGRFAVEWGEPQDLARSLEVCIRHKALKPGLVDGVVIAIAERLRARAIATLDLRHFGSIPIRHGPKLLPRDL